MKKSIILQHEFSSAHFYHQPQWSDEKNREVFGRCFTEYGHGHNYVLKSEWPVSTEAEAVKIHQEIQKIVSQLDHEHLNFVIPEFQTQIPTTEVILQYLHQKFLQSLSVKPLNLELFETPEIGARLV